MIINFFNIKGIDLPSIHSFSRKYPSRMSSSLLARLLNGQGNQVCCFWDSFCRLKKQQFCRSERKNFGFWLSKQRKFSDSSQCVLNSNRPSWFVAISTHSSTICCDASPKWACPHYQITYFLVITSTEGLKIWRRTFFSIFHNFTFLLQNRPFVLFQSSMAK